ncbi:hypothetical protein WR25_14524 [Diploscapter pachys]|uniref:Lipid-binding serum glycoprotein C-terminal domain-containing protein n=1 Tax=Diploscapter pachys TaxID=2018661 RepID=A0A2A2JUB7_9BILA|nr:hypothetical protein WR25_14524 [Diploscapter pachys]
MPRDFHLDFHPPTAVKIHLISGNNSISQSGNAIFENAICTKLIQIINDRVNKRFELLPTKVPLAEASNFDVVEKIAEAEERAKRRTTGRRRLSSHRRSKRQQRRMHAFLRGFDWRKINALFLDYSMVTPLRITTNGIEVGTSGQISMAGVTTPFVAAPLALPNEAPKSMLTMIVSDFVPNTLMYHGHRVGLFNTKVEPRTPSLGPMMRTTCDLSTGSLFCLGDIFPTLRDTYPNKYLMLEFKTLHPPNMIIKSEKDGGIKFSVIGLITLTGLNGMIPTGNERPLGSMEINLKAKVDMRLASSFVRGKLTLEDIKFTTRTPKVLTQEELDDAGFLSREIMQRMVNDILKQGIPIPVHPLFKLSKPKLSLTNRAMVFQTDFDLNEAIIKQLTSANLRKS